MVQTEIGGFVYGLQKGKKFYLKGIVPVFEKATNDEIDNQRTEMYIKIFRKSNPDYLFFQYHSHPNGSIQPSPEDVDMITDLEIILWAEAEFTKNFLRKNISRVGYGTIKAYKVKEKNGEKKIKEIPIKIVHSHKL